MKAIALLLILSCASMALGSLCTTTNGVTCCGLTIVSFSADIFQTFANQLGYFADEGLTVCNVFSKSSVEIYDDILLKGKAELSATQIDNSLWRRMNFGVDLAVIAGTDGQRGFYLVGNTQQLGGNNEVTALSNKNIVVDSVDSGFVVGLKKTLVDYGVTNYTFIPYGTNRLGVVTAGNLNGVPIAATMQNNIAPYLIKYPVVELTKQADHFCPTQGTGYMTTNTFLRNSTNRADVVKFLRALLRSYLYVSNPVNRAAVNQYISTSVPTTDPNIIELVYNDYFNNHATGVNPNLTPRKAGLRNEVNTRVDLKMSPYPAEGAESFITDKVGGFVDLSPLREAQASLQLNNNYDTDGGLLGCPVFNKGTVTSVPELTCSVMYTISNQPPQWPTGMTGSISVYVNNATLLTQNGAPGWAVSFTGNFDITSSWNTGSVSKTNNANGSKTYTITNPQGYNQQAPQNIGFNAATTAPAPGNNICGVTINGYPCIVSTPSTVSMSC